MADTICALASGRPPAGIGIIRVSGPDVRNWMAAHITGPPLVPRRAGLRIIRDLQGGVVDKGLTLFMPAPDTYTGEDVLELNVHGGAAVVAAALDVLTAFEGIRLAEPGEFTRRAFEAGKLDLTQAEGVADLIEAETQAQKIQAQAQTDGVLSQLYNGWREDVLAALALTEVSVDFPDEADVPDGADLPVRAKLGALSKSFEQALEQGRLHESVRDGFRVAIIGAPNVGKSTLLNRFAGRDAAIVTDIPGTTRDVLEVRCRIGSHIVWFADTAGLRETSDRIEAEGIRRAKRTAEDADLRVYLADANSPPPPPSLLKSGDLLVHNKMDLAVNKTLTGDLVGISALEGAGVDELLLRIEQLLDGRVSGSGSPVITRARHRLGIEAALKHVEHAGRLLAGNAGAELVAEEIRLGGRALAALVGEIDVEDVLGAVFSEFCIGK